MVTRPASLLVRLFAGDGGMLHAKVIRPPSYGATLVNADTAAAAAMKGVTVVRDGNFFAVAAPTIAAATEAAAIIKAEWTSGTGVSGRTLFADLKTKAERAVDTPFDAQYTIAYIAHAPLEPRAAVAEWADGQLTGRPARNARSACGPSSRRRSTRFGGSRPGDRAGHRLRLRRQTHRGRRAVEAAPHRAAAQKPVSGPGRGRKSSRGPTSGPPASSTCTAASERRHAHRVGVPQLQFRPLWVAHAFTPSRTSGRGLSPLPLRARVHIAGWPPPRIISRAKPIWTNSRARPVSIRSPSA